MSLGKERNVQRIYKYFEHVGTLEKGQETNKIGRKEITIPVFESDYYRYVEEKKYDPRGVKNAILL